MRFTPWATRLALTLSLSATAFLAACGGGGGGGSSTQVRLLNATRSYAQLDLTVNDKTINSKVAYATAGEYGSVDTSATATKVLTSDVGTSIVATTPTLNGGSNYTQIVYGFAGAVRTALLEENVEVPEANKAKLLVMNLAPDAGALDIYVTTATEDLATATALSTNLQGGAGSGYIQINSGTFRVRVTGYNNRADLRLDIPAVTLDSASVNSLILTASEGGVLVNGIKLIQKGAVSNFANTQSRVRTVAAMTAGSTVGSSINGQQMFAASGAISPLVSNYVTTNAGASTLAATVNGAAVTFTAPTLTAGQDYTLLVWGDAAAPKMSVLSDDNRLPTVSGNVKIRLVNALPTVSSSLNVDFSAIATNVASGAVSTIGNISSTTASQVEVTVPTSATPIFNNNSTTLAFPANSVWTFFSVPSPSATQGMTAIPKRERP